MTPGSAETTRAPTVAPHRVVALGSGAGHVLNHLLHTGGLAWPGIAMNTDAQDLRRSLAQTKLQFGTQIVRGLGCGGDPEVGRACALADRAALEAALAGADLVIVVVGLGGGTGSGAAPLVCAVAWELGVNVLAAVTLPFPFEGRRRRRVGEEALVALREAAAGRVVVAETPIPPEDGPRITMQELFARSDGAVAHVVRAAVDIVGGGTGGSGDPARDVELRRLLRGSVSSS